jgi:hypothetical protein
VHAHHPQRADHAAGDVMNNLSLAIIVAGIVAPLAHSDINGLGSVIIWTAIGLDFIGLAQVVLGRLRS